MNTEYMGVDASGIEAESSVLVGKEVWIMPALDYSYLPEKYNSKAKLEALVVRLGGSITQNNMGDSTDFIIASSESNLRVRVAGRAVFVSPVTTPCCRPCRICFARHHSMFALPRR